MKDKYKLLPDSDLPVEAEAKRNIEHIIGQAEQRLEKFWEQPGALQATRNLVQSVVKEVLFEELHSIFEDRIRCRRGIPNEQ